MTQPDPVLPILAAHGWPTPSDAELRDAHAAAAERLRDADRAARALRSFYQPTGRYAGRTFLDLQPNLTDDLTAADLLAITLLDVSANPLAVRRLLGPGQDRDRVLAALKRSRDRDLAADDIADDLLAAAHLYETVKPTLGDNPWVVASKLCARKRPALIPVRDSRVVKILRLTNRDFRSDWLVYRHLLRDAEIQAMLRDAVEQTRSDPSIDVTDLPLTRVLDSILWMLRGHTE